MAQINKTVLMSGAEYFSVKAAINPYMDAEEQVNRGKAIAEHESIEEALKSAGVKVIKTKAPENCQDGVYTANWGLCRGNKVVLASLPDVRQPEIATAEKFFKKRGMTIIHPPEGLRFSGQGDALPCGKWLLAGSQYRTDKEVHKFLADKLGFKVISLQTVPDYDQNGQPKINEHSGWPDSFFYDIDLAISVLKAPSKHQKGLIAWCPEAFTPESQDKIADLPLDTIEVTLAEARHGFACNLVSTGETVIMSARAPLLQSAIELHGLKTITPDVTELGKGGGYIRCTTLTLDN